MKCYPMQALKYLEADIVADDKELKEATTLRNITLRFVRKC